MSAFKMVKDIIRRQFVSGVLVVVPLILTYAVLKFLFEAIDGILSPIIFKLFGYSIPGLGIITTLLLILLTGFFIRSLVGASVYKRADRLLTKAPLIRIFYLAAKQLIEAFTVPNVRGFKDVVMVEYLRPGLYAIGFATSQVRFIKQDEVTKKLVGVFVPSTPTPISGIVVFVSEEDVTPLNMSAEEALKLVVSGGIVSPDEIAFLERRDSIRIEESDATR